MNDPSAASLLQQYVEASIHLILHQRRVYEQEIFERRRLFDVTIFRSRHVELNDYIALVADGARELLERGEADAVVISIMGEPRDGSSAGSSAQEVLERFRLSFHPPPPSQSHAIGSGVGSGAGPSSSADLDALRAHLRGFLLKLHVCDTLLPPLPRHMRLSFTCELHTDPTRSAQPLTPQLLQQWVECGPRDGGSSGASSGPAGGGAILIPLKSLSLDDGTTVSLNAMTYCG